MFYIYVVIINFYVQFLKLNFKGISTYILKSTYKDKISEIKKIPCKIAQLSIYLDAAIFIVFSPISDTPRKFKHLYLRHYRMENEL